MLLIKARLVRHAKREPSSKYKHMIRMDHPYSTINTAFVFPFYLISITQYTANFHHSFTTTYKYLHSYLFFYTTEVFIDMRLAPIYSFIARTTLKYSALCNFSKVS
ncbi:hypothetical protein AMTRI_Chr04g248700 [Amborella trichopoda]